MRVSCKENASIKHLVQCLAQSENLLSVQDDTFKNQLRHPQLPYTTHTHTHTHTHTGTHSYHTCFLHSEASQSSPSNQMQGTHCVGEDLSQQTYRTKTSKLASEFQQLWCPWNLEERFGMMNSQVGTILATISRFKRRKKIVGAVTGSFPIFC